MKLELPYREVKANFCYKINLMALRRYVPVTFPAMSSERAKRGRKCIESLEAMVEREKERKRGGRERKTESGSEALRNI